LQRPVALVTAYRLHPRWHSSSQFRLYAKINTLRAI
jgi:hypothetical protein